MSFINLPKDADWFTVSQFALNTFQGLTRNDMNQPLTTTMESLELAEVVCDWTFVNAAVIISACVFQLLCFAERRLQTNWFGWFQNCIKSPQFWCLKLKVLSFTQTLFNKVPCSVLPRVYLLCLVHNRFFGRIPILFHVTIYKPTKPPWVSIGWSWVLFPINVFLWFW